MNKVFSSCPEAVADIDDGAVVMVGGWAYSGAPRGLLSALRDCGAMDLAVGARKVIVLRSMLRHRDSPRLFAIAPIR